MRRGSRGRPVEYVRVPVADPFKAEERGTDPGLRHAAAMQHLVAHYAANGWVFVAVRPGVSAPEALFRRLLPRPSAA